MYNKNFSLFLKIESKSESLNGALLLSDLVSYAIAT